MLQRVENIFAKEESVLNEMTPLITVVKTSFCSKCEKLRLEAGMG